MIAELTSRGRSRICSARAGGDKVRPPFDAQVIDELPTFPRQIELKLQ